MRTLLIAPLLLLFACGSDGSETIQQQGTLSSAWPDDTLWAVLQAQDHRDVQALLGFLVHKREDVRERAALAFASHPDTAARKALIHALGDPSAIVRKAVAVAIGNATDSISWRALSAASDAERDTSVLRVMLEQTLKAEVDLGRAKDPERLWQLLASGNQRIRMRAAQQLARSQPDRLAPMEPRLLNAASEESDTHVRMFLVGALRHFNSNPVMTALMAMAQGDKLVAIRVSALRALGNREDEKLAVFFLDRMNDGSQAARLTAVEQLQRIKKPLDADEIWKVAQAQGDPFTQLPLYGLVLKHGSGGTRLIARELLKAQAMLDNMDQAEAAILRAQSNDSLQLAETLVMSWLAKPSPALLYNTAAEALVELARRAKPVERPRLRGELIMLLSSPDVGVLATVADAVAGGDLAWAREGLSVEQVRSRQNQLTLPRDYEAWFALEKLAAVLGGMPEPRPAPPAWGHPIDHMRLAAIAHGQQYRIKTNRGEIALALEPMSAPGSCVAFDSLASAGFYNGKYFHRVIPNFVAQGGCPRGDGWGSMDWTLRTEIGYEGFTKGAVGLASAGRDTESCQFFIMTAPAPHLDGRYTRFAHVVEGMDVAERLVVGDVILALEKMP